MNLFLWSNCFLILFNDVVSLFIISHFFSLFIGFNFLNPSFSGGNLMSCSITFSSVFSNSFLDFCFQDFGPVPDIKHSCTCYWLLVCDAIMLITKAVISNKTKAKNTWSSGSFLSWTNLQQAIVDKLFCVWKCLARTLVRASINIFALFLLSITFKCFTFLTLSLLLFNMWFFYLQYKNQQIWT